MTAVDVSNNREVYRCGWMVGDIIFGNTVSITICTGGVGIEKRRYMAFNFEFRPDFPKARGEVEIS